DERGDETDCLVHHGMTRDSGVAVRAAIIIARRGGGRASLIMRKSGRGSLAALLTVRVCLVREVAEPRLRLGSPFGSQLRAIVLNEPLLVPGGLAVILTSLVGLREHRMQ